MLSQPLPGMLDAAQGPDIYQWRFSLRKIWSVNGLQNAVQVNVIHGCNEKCTYCVVPNTRGVEQSRAPEAIKVGHHTHDVIDQHAAVV